MLKKYPWQKFHHLSSDNYVRQEKRAEDLKFAYKGGKNNFHSAIFTCFNTTISLSCVFKIHM